MINQLHSAIVRIVSAALCLALSALFVRAIEPAPAPTSAKDLAASLSAMQDGPSYVRLRLEVKEPPGTPKTTLQLQIKQRRTRSTSVVIYQVLWPKERKGESVLLRKADGSAPTGSLYVPPDKPRPLEASRMNEALFGSDLSYQDIIENFFGWEDQAIVGTEVLKNVSCLILESKPGRGEPSNYARVRSWIDARRLVPLRVEKYLPSGQLARRIETTRVATDDKGRFIPADLIVHGLREDSVTDLDGSRIRHDVSYTDQDFTAEGLSVISAPTAAPE